MAKVVNWTEPEIDFLKANYTKMSAEIISQKLFEISNIERNPKAVKSYANRNGLKKKWHWSKEEIDYLAELIGEYPFEKLVKRFQDWAVKNNFSTRSPGQIKSKIAHQKKSIRLNASSKYLTTQDIKYLLGCDRTSVTNIFNQYRSELKPKQEGGKKYVSRRKFKQFLLSHTSILIRYQNKLDIAWLADILGGIKR